MTIPKDALAADTPDSARDRTRVRRGWSTVVVGTVCLMLLAGGAWMHYRAHADEYWAKSGEQLRLIAEAKATQVGVWRKERLSDGQFLYQAPFVANHVERVLEGDRGASYEAMRAWLHAIRGGDRYYDASVYDAALQPIVRHSTEASDEIDSCLREAIARATSEAGVFMTDVLRADPRARRYIAIVSPIFLRHGRRYNEHGSFTPSGPPAAFIILRLRPEQFLDPLLKEWPEPTLSGETILARRQGDTVVYLSELRFRSAMPDVPPAVGSSQLPVARALRGERGLMDGTDYRGERVLSVFRPVSGTAWVVGAKIDHRELAAPMRSELIHTIVVAAALTLAGFACLGWFWRARENEFLAQRLHAETARRESEERFRLIAATINEVFWMADVAITRNFYVSPAYERVWGRSLASLAENPRAFIDAIHPDDRERVVALLDRHRDGEPFDHEYRVVHPDGTVRWIRDRGNPVRDAAGQVTHYAGVAEDITEQVQTRETLRRNEERLTYAARAISDVIWDWDLRTERIWFSEGFHRIFGYGSGETVENVVELKKRVHPDDRERVLAEIAKVMIGTDTTCRLEYRFRRRDGSYVHVSDHGFVIRNARGAAVRVVGGITDLTERKKLEREIAQRERELNAFFSSASAGLALLDAEQRYVQINDTLAEMNGLPAAEHIGRSVAEVVPHLAPLITPLIERVLRGGESIPSTEVAGGDRDAVGGVRHWIVSYFPISGPDEKVEGVGVCVVEITDRKRAEEALRASEERFAAMFRASPVGISLTTPEGRLVDANPHLCRISGYTREELVGRNVHELNVWDDPAQRASLVAQLQRTKSVRNAEVRLRDKGGKLFTTLYFAELLEVSREPLLMTAMIDITDRKAVEDALRESEQRFRQLAENISEAFWVLDWKTQRLLYVSPAFEKIWGRTVGQAYQPDTWLNSIHPDDRARMSAAVQKQAAGKYRESYRILRPDGAIRWIRDRAFPIRDAEGEVYRIVGVAEDITEWRRLEAQFREAQKMEALGTLAGGIAHDFNNILAAINGYATLARTATAPGEADGYLEEVLRASARAASLVRQILAFSRRQEHVRTPLKLSRVVQETVKLLRATIPTSIEFDVDPGRDTPAILADATQVQQVIMNLGTNAAHAMRNRAGVLRIGVTRVEVDEALAAERPGLRSGPHVCMAISDTGHGMDRRVLDRIFEPFFTTKPPGEGTGLGLSVVHGIMQSHEGAVAVRSEAGVGTTFHLYFPAIAAEVSPAHQPAPPAPRGQGERILIVDDEEQMARMMRLTLEQMGYAAQACTKPAEALAAFRAQPQAFSLLVTDQTMPGMTGIEVASEATRVRPDLPIILTSGYSDALTPENLSAAGVREVLMKPASPDALAAAVHRALHPKTQPASPCHISS